MNTINAWKKYLLSYINCEKILLIDLWLILRLVLREEETSILNFMK